MKTDFYRQYTLKISPFPLYCIYYNLCHGFKELLGDAMECVFSEFKDGKSMGYFSKSDVLRVGNLAVSKIEKEDNFIQFLRTHFDKEISVLQNIAEKGNTVNESTPNEELSELFTKYVEDYNKTYLYGGIPFIVDFALEEQGFNIIQDKVPDQIKAQKIFSAFTFPTGNSWNIIEELELLSFIEKKNPDLTEHAKKWEWLEYDYEGNSLSLEYFQNKIKEFTPEKIKKLKTLKDTQTKNEELKKTYSTKLQFSQEEQRILNAVGKLAYFKEYRKGLITKTLFLVEPLLKEIGKRKNFTLEQIRYFLPEEIKELLVQNKDFKEIIEQRMNYSIFVQKNNSQKFLVENEAKQFYKDNYKEDIDYETKEIKGTVASMGKVKGKVKIIITVKDMEKMNQGDIIVSSMTNPDLMPAIGKAAAIITDTGGLTSHAAIVSRELNVPCIIGTTHATRILKDNDEVEVDANKGIITIL
tara:strand:- start:1 stop:1407 length:1407 start_codon:yes stop_codon:yes gene_type:complete